MHERRIPCRDLVLLALQLLRSRLAGYELRQAGTENSGALADLDAELLNAAAEIDGRLPGARHELLHAAHARGRAVARLVLRRARVVLGGILALETIERALGSLRAGI